MKKIIMFLIITMTITSTVNAAELQRESAPCNATNEAIIVVESYIGDILTEVQNGLGYSDARAKSNRIFFDAFLKIKHNKSIYNNFRNKLLKQRRILFHSAPSLIKIFLFTFPFVFK